MKINQVKEIARQYEIKTGKSKKSDLVRSIQLAEGNNPCFDSGISTQCAQESCMWREDCV